MFKKLKQNKNYKLIIGLIIGFLVSSSVVSALYLGTASEFSYDSSNTWLTSTTVQDALDELNIYCRPGYVCKDTKTTLALGDYISYTPSSSSYTTDTTKTGCANAQTINPSELTLWRVLSLNQNGTVDIISEYVSSVAVCFGGLTGYQNVVGYLEILASQYENSTYTVDSRHFGYDSQTTEYITDTTYFTYPAPWPCATSSTCTPNPRDYEAYGGGDMGYQSDYNLVKTVLGTRSAKRQGTALYTNYWISSRYYYNYSGSTSYYWGTAVPCSGGSSATACSNIMYEIRSNGNNITSNQISYSVRPIVTLKSGLTYEGIGTKDYPMEIQ